MPPSASAPPTVAIAVHACYLIVVAYLRLGRSGLDQVVVYGDKLSRRRRRRVSLRVIRALPLFFTLLSTSVLTLTSSSQPLTIYSIYDDHLTGLVRHKSLHLHAHALSATQSA